MVRSQIAATPNTTATASNDQSKMRVPRRTGISDDSELVCASALDTERTTNFTDNLRNGLAGVDDYGIPGFFQGIELTA